MVAKLLVSWVPDPSDPSKIFNMHAMHAMHSRRALVSALLLSPLVAAARDDSKLQVIQIPVRFHLGTDLIVPKGGQALAA